MSDDGAGDAYNAEWARLWQEARGRDVAEAERLVREWAARCAPYAEEWDLQLLACVMSDPRWAQHHPVAALAMAWRHRRSRPVHRSLRLLWRPRFAG